MPWSLNGMVAEALAYHSDFAMNDNEGTIPQQIAHLEGIAATMRDDLKEARAGLQAKPGDERLAKQVNALERLLNGVLLDALERLASQRQLLHRGIATARGAPASRIGSVRAR